MSHDTDGYQIFQFTMIILHLLRHINMLSHVLEDYSVDPTVAF